MRFVIAMETDDPEASAAIERLLEEAPTLSFAKAEFRRLHKPASQGDEQSLQQIEAIWNPYRDHSIECFLCPRKCEHPPFAMLCRTPPISPNSSPRRSVLLAATCQQCSAGTDV